MKEGKSVLRKVCTENQEIWGQLPCGIQFWEERWIKTICVCVCGVLSNLFPRAPKRFSENVFMIFQRLLYELIFIVL